MVKHIDNQEFKVVDNQIIIPLSDEVVKELQINQNDTVTISTINNQLIIEPSRQDKVEFNKIIETIADENDETFKQLVSR